MPGGRLTQDDRRQIAEGIAEGLGYAEIARQLNRPTSTVSREVIRNGGPGRYHPGRAHRATELRARRHRSRGASAESAPAAGDVVLDEFVTQFVAQITRTGVPRTAAAALACLYTTDSGSLTAAELAQRLRVSPATISAAINMLETQGLVQRERDARSRRDRYFVDDNIWVHATMVSARQVCELAAVTRRGAELLGSDTPAGVRAYNTSRFLDFVGHDMVESAERWRKLLQQQRTQD
ncbi:helix-turn-helix domain-containing protein [Nocardia ninae]|uniref:MarR family transcriptional regulator n=1 Tax=Nocardia ninae NBRC 108245 TaxID=1210091 RepID=A0A511MGC8_9NOCA|nr:helix-turn-helix domain-containing protein [Nocardia ninae]GEM39740.1 MarR family transcriptional regulator [Nocardia ninae NBRC 108245]